MHIALSAPLALALFTAKTFLTLTLFALTSYAQLFAFAGKACFTLFLFALLTYLPRLVFVLCLINKVVKKPSLIALSPCLTTLTGLIGFRFTLHPLALLL